MPKYADYPVATTLSAADVVLIHQDSSNAEKVISVTNIGIALTPFLVPATTVAQGAMSAADKLLLASATQLNTASTLVLRDAQGNIAIGSLQVSASLGGTGNITAAGGLVVGAGVMGAAGSIVHSGNLTTGGNVDVTGTSAFSGILTAFKVAGNGGIKLNGSTGVGKAVIESLLFTRFSIVFAGGAPTENFDAIQITGAFNSVPNWGIMIPEDPHYNATFLDTAGGNTVTTSKCQLYHNDGTNIVAGTKIIMGLFAYLK